MTTVTNLEVIYDALTAIHSRFEGVEGISVYFTESGLVITATWMYRDIEKMLTVQHVISREEFENCIEMNTLEETVFNEIERQHMVWEVGEE